MKMTTSQPRQVLLTTVLALVPMYFGFAADTNAPASDANASQPAAASAPAVSAAPAQAPVAVKLPYGVEDVLKLSKAQIGDEIILNYVQNSGTIYNLEPKDIVYLRDQGVSEKVISTMLNQRRHIEMAAQNVAPQTVPNAPMVPEAPMVAADNTASAQPSADANATYATAPLTPSASTSYVIPYPAATAAYYGYPYYPYYYGPSVSFAVGFGGYYGGRCYYGGHGYYGGHCYYGGGHGFHGGHH
jgi:hypothetical protein